MDGRSNAVGGGGGGELFKIEKDENLTGFSFPSSASPGDIVSSAYTVIVSPLKMTTKSGLQMNLAYSYEQISSKNIQPRVPDGGYYLFVMPREDVQISIL